MFSPVGVVIDAFCAETRRAFQAAFPNQSPDLADVLDTTTRMALEILANTDAAYHDLEHTLLVTQVGQEILRGKRVADADVTPELWVEFVVSLLFHDIGYVRGICRGDRGGRYVIDAQGSTAAPPVGATDAWMTPYHVDRGQIFIRERFAGDRHVDAEAVCRNIELTRFPVPAARDYQGIDDFPGLVRAADLIGQLADPRYLQKLSRLYAEFRETGEADRRGYRSPADLREAYPAFYWNLVSPYIPEALRLLRKTQSGQQVLANLFGHVFEEEHESPAYGPERRACDDRRRGTEGTRPEAERRRTAGRRSADPDA
ncbi:MAG TPA: hypothetical protein VLA56_05015 [Pseudomonadales bacterium]|nr:hypothetical protein [Pseudomonadales bacterium]